MTKKEICDTHRTIAHYSGFGGLEVKHIEFGIDDYLYIVAGTWNKKSTYHKLKVNYGKCDYILFRNRRCRLNDLIRN